jgi:hypothetical protein
MFGVVEYGEKLAQTYSRYLGSIAQTETQSSASLAMNFLISLWTLWVLTKFHSRIINDGKTISAKKTGQIKTEADIKQEIKTRNIVSASVICFALGMVSLFVDSTRLETVGLILFLTGFCLLGASVASGIAHIIKRG